MASNICQNCKHRWYQRANGHIDIWCFAKKTTISDGLLFCKKYQEAKGYEKHAVQVLEEILEKEKEKEKEKLK